MRRNLRCHVAVALAATAIASCADQAKSPRTAERAGVKQPRSTAAARSATSDSAARLPAVAPKPKADRDDAYRERIVGIWKQFENGVRWLKVRPDGTATMFIDPDWIAKAVIGDGLTVQIEWSIDDGRVRMRSVSGEPATTFKAVTALYGSDRDRPIVELSDEDFVMLDEDGGDRSTWMRVGADEQLPAALRDAVSTRESSESRD